MIPVQVTVSNEINNLTLCFYYFRWLDEGEDDGKIVRELKIQEEYMDDILEKRNVRLIKCSFLLDVI